MVCPECGSAVAEGSNFCPRCGTAVVHVASASTNGPPAGTPNAGPYQIPLLMHVPRVPRNLQGLGVLWCVYGAYRLLGASIGMLALRAFTMPQFFGWSFDSGFGSGFGSRWLVGVLPIIALVAFSAAALALFVGYSLLNRRPWGRVLAMVAASFALLKFPVGTALGIYTLWVLASSRSRMEYEAIAERG